MIRCSRAMIRYPQVEQDLILRVPGIQRGQISGSLGFSGDDLLMPATYELEARECHNAYLLSTFTDTRIYMGGRDYVCEVMYVFWSWHNVDLWALVPPG